MDSDFYAVKSGPKNMYWGSASEDEYYVIIKGELLKKHPDMYRALVNLMIPASTNKRKELQITGYTDDTMGLGFRHNNGNLGFIIKKAVVEQELTESIYKQLNKIDDEESLNERYNKNGVDVTKLPKMISESNFLEPIRVRVKIDTSDAKFRSGYDLQAAINRTIGGVSLQPEILVDESDGSYQLCFPGKSDWLKSVTEMLQYNISSKLTVEEV